MQLALQPKFISYVSHGLEVLHAHIHIMPRKSETAFVPPEIKIDNEEMKKTASEIRSSLKL
jgi:diadenosine tetraphosphate (Ap4A) HIT family hydrolase